MLIVHGKKEMTGMKLGELWSKGIEGVLLHCYNNRHDKYTAVGYLLCRVVTNLQLLVTCCAG